MSGQATLEPAPAAPPPGRRRWTARRLRFVGLVTGALLAMAVTGLVLWLPHLSGSSNGTASESKVPVAWERPAVSKADLAGGRTCQGLGRACVIGSAAGVGVRMGPAVFRWLGAGVPTLTYATSLGQLASFGLP